jgi:activator of HSP90 ATPase
VYNINNNANKAKNTILINKKAESNTLYSINALNSIIQELNNGILDKRYIIDWSQYKDNLLLTDKETGYKKIHITELKSW